jgi:hypothetical protein
LLVLAVACRFDFDPLVDAGAAAVANTVWCTGPSCVVDCRAWASCTVDCGPSSYACVVQCPTHDCTVTSCVPGICDVLCGDAPTAMQTGSVATCP